MVLSREPNFKKVAQFTPPDATIRNRKMAAMSAKKALIFSVFVIISYNL